MDSNLLHADTVENDDENALLEKLSDIGSINKEIKGVGLPAVHCSTCAPQVANLVLPHNDLKIDIGKPYYLNEKEPYIIYLNRNANSPSKATLKLKNGYRYCAKTYAGLNPLSYNGPFILGCMLYLTQYEDEEISLDLSNLPLLKNDEKDVIEIKFLKTKLNSASYEIKVQSLNNSHLKKKINKKFFGDGFNVKFELENE
jgi:hypothetical protein